jgi:hypothetical protein
VEERLDEMTRLEVAEHLGFCDECLMRYTGMLCDDALLSPAQPVAPRVVQRLRRKTVHVGWLRYGTVAAAACMAVVMWGAGSHLLAQQDPQPDLVPQQEQRQDTSFWQQWERKPQPEEAAPKEDTWGFDIFSSLRKQEPAQAPAQQEKAAQQSAGQSPDKQSPEKQDPDKQEAAKEESLLQTGQRESLFGRPVPEDDSK